MQKRQGTLGAGIPPAAPHKAGTAAPPATGSKGAPAVHKQPTLQAKVEYDQFKGKAKSPPPAKAPPVVSTHQCELSSVACECSCQKEGPRKSSEEAVLAIVPPQPGEVIKVIPTTAKGHSGCVTYQLFDEDMSPVRKFSGTSVKIDGWPQVTQTVKIKKNVTFSWPSDLSGNKSPRLFLLRGTDRAGSTAETELLVYPFAEDKVTLSTDDILEAFVKRSLDPLIQLINKFFDKRYNLLSKDGLEVKLGSVSYLKVLPPNINLEYTGSWKEFPPGHKTWWQAYFAWNFKLKADPIIGLSFTVDLAGAVLMAVAPALMPVYGGLRKHLNEEEPPLYFTAKGEASGEIKGEEDLKQKVKITGEITGKFSGEVGIKIGGEIMKAEASAGGPLVGVTIKCLSGNENCKAIIDGELTLPVIKGKIKVQLRCNCKWLQWKWLSTEWEKETAFWPASGEAEKIPLVHCELFPKALKNE